ncbi:MAG: EscU/YscU/HrcU family type III secretion system export apparatus switch protein [Alphaproteobacteria bacterium]|uniref:EscU/YscU/HrcU family type III secretion system export apparatus switch protein n=1 Tax=Candidatus Nitrobium versatile TaxID=2884831 RepID=A0A953M3V4_9BACT|nr:EscU/YscU/HrcU family type III secretion system export apparatus switch protein [Candidatus Nitrobium versatile]
MADTRKKAAALRYDAKKDAAPKLVAKGSGVIAEQILKIAGEHKIPLKEDRQLLEVLSTLDLYQEIPPELYKAVAEILAFVYRMTKKKG